MKGKIQVFRECMNIKKRKIPYRVKSLIRILGSMKQKNPLIVMAVFIISVIILVIKLFEPKPIQILIEEGKALPVESSGLFTFGDVLLMVISAWIAGMTLLYLLYKEEKEEEPKDSVSAFVMRVLKGDEKKIYQQLLDTGGEMLQKDLVLSSGFGKAKVTRLLDKLEKKGLITKTRHGMTNKVTLKKE
jgi:uncharacterized membrane protein